MKLPVHWEAARKEASVVQSALRTLLNLQDTCSIHPTSELFINNQLPAKEEFLQAMRVENYTVNQLQLQSQIARQQLRIDQSGYLPDIAVFGKQTLYAHGIQSNLVPPHHRRCGLHLEPVRRTGA